MMKFIQMETKKIALKPYLLSVAGITLAGLVMPYLLALVPYLEPEAAVTDPTLQSYSFFYLIIALVNIIGYSCLCATMLGKYVMEAYSGKNAYLTLSYPVQRTKILRAKVVLCFLICSIGVILSLLFSSFAFFGLESIFSLVEDQLIFSTLVEQWPFVLIAPLLVTSIGIISLQIGWARQSLALIIFSAIILCSFLSNLVTLGNLQVFAVAAVFFLIVGLVGMSLLKRKIIGLEL